MGDSSGAARAIRAVVFRDVASGGTLEPVTLGPPEAGEVLVRVAVSGICGSDLHVLHGRSNGVRPPAIMGHEGAGVVRAVGTGVGHVQPGDRVMVAMGGLDGASRAEVGGETLHPFVGSGSLAEYVVVPAHQAIPLPPAVPIDVGAIVACGVMTGVGAVLNIAQVPEGATVAVIGCGGVGLSVIQGCRVAGASRVVAVDANPRKDALALSMGATDFVTAGTGGFGRDVLRLVPGGVDYTFEAVGRTELVTEAFGCLAVRGACVATAVYPPGSVLQVPASALFMNRRLLGCAGGGGVGGTATEADRIFSLYLDGRLDLDALITHRFPLDRVADAFAVAERGEAGRVLVTMDEH